ncbi:MAG: hypothetical protein KC910_15975 [Candidatus Eremiobacteraeota bacterium]|nr:hypothetical protein [Candidatus Eremiobacteraeota bacterium]
MKLPWTFALLLLLTTGAFAREKTVALVADAQGQVQLLQAGQKSQAALLSYLSPGTRMQLGPKARASLAFVEGGLRVDLSGPCQVALEESGVKLLEGGPGAVTSTRPQTRQGKSLPRDVNIARGGGVRRDPELALTVGQAILPGDSIHWQAADTINGFQVFLWEGDRRLLREEVERQTRELALAPDLLEPGHSYEVELAGYRVSGQEVVLKKQVKVLGAEACEQITGLEKAATGVAGKTALLSVYLDLGLDYKSLKLTEDLLKQRPEDANLTRLQGELRKSLGLSD